MQARPRAVIDLDILEKMTEHYGILKNLVFYQCERQGAPMRGAGG